MKFSSLVTVRSLLVYAVCLFQAACAATRTFPGKDTSSRWNEYEQGNRIGNASFEQLSQGKPSQWQGKGCNIRLDAAHGGAQSLLLRRAIDQEAPVCRSDPIGVVAGHYDFSMWVRGEKLVTLEEGLHAPLLVRLALFDASGAEIGMWNIAAELDGAVWDAGAGGGKFTKLHLRQRPYPFQAGWIDKEVHSVQLELEFQGQGELLVDDVEFRFSKWNFPLYERVRYLAQSQPLPPVFPSPQRIDLLPVIWRLAERSSQSICFEGRPSSAQFLRELEDTLLQFGFKAPLLRKSCEGAVHRIIAGTPRELAQVLSQHGQLATLSLRDAESFALRYLSERNGQDAVVVVGGGSRGIAYGIRTLRQLLRKESDGALVWHMAEVDDAPQTALRAFAARDQRRRGFLQELSAAQWLAESRFNAMFLEVDPRFAPQWHMSKTLTDAAQRLGQESHKGGLFDFGVSINPYLWRVDPHWNRSFAFHDAADQARLKKVIGEIVRQHAKFLMLRTDDFTPEADGVAFAYHLDDPADQELFHTLGRAHADLLQGLVTWLGPEHPRLQVMFVPPWYNLTFLRNGKERALEYYRELASLLPKSIGIFWTGPAVRSLTIDDVEEQAFRAHIGSRQLLLWDNTPYARRHEEFWGRDIRRVELSSYFEPYDVQGARSSGVFMNVAPTALNRIQLATAGAYFWNPERYNAEQSLWHYLVLRFGRAGADTLLRLDTKLWEIKRALLSAAPADATAQLREQATLLLRELHRTIGPRDGDLIDELNEVLLKLY